MTMLLVKKRSLPWTATAAAWNTPLALLSIVAGLALTNSAAWAAPPMNRTAVTKGKAGDVYTCVPTKHGQRCSYTAAPTAKPSSGAKPTATTKTTTTGASTLPKSSVSFDGTYRFTQTSISSGICPGVPAQPPVRLTNSGTRNVVNGTLEGHAISISASGLTGTVTWSKTLQGVTLTEQVTLTRSSVADGAEISMSGIVTGFSHPAGCDIKVDGTFSGSRISK